MRSGESNGTRAAPTAPAEPSLTQRASHGFAAMGIQAVVSKVLGTATHFALAWLLSPDAFGVIGLAYTVTALVTVLQDAGLNEVLVRHRAAFDRWAGPAFRLALLMSGVACVVMLVAAPVAARVYRRPDLVWLIVLLASALPIQAFSIVPRAKLQMDMSFRFLARLRFIVAVATAVLTVGLAALGFGAYSMVIPRPAIAMLELVALWTVCRPPVRARGTWGAYRSLLGDSALLVATGLVVTVASRADYAVLGLFHSAQVVGVYYFAYNLSTQALMLAVSNLSYVLLPAFVHIGDKGERVLHSYLRASRLINAIGIPACAIQAAVAGPFIRAFFRAEWGPAVPVLQILSVGWALRIAAIAADAFLRSKGRFRELLVFYSGYTACVLLAVAVGAKYWGAVGAAWGVAFALAVSAPIQKLLSIRPHGGTLRHVWQVYWAPLAATGLAMLPPWWVLDRPGVANIPALIGISAFSVPVYALLLRWLAPATWADVKERALEVGARLRPRHVV